MLLVLSLLVAATNTDNYELSPKTKAAVQMAVIIGACNRYISANDHVDIFRQFKKYDDEIEKKTGERIIMKIYNEGVNSDPNDNLSKDMCEGMLQATKMLMDEL